MKAEAGKENDDDELLPLISSCGSMPDAASGLAPSKDVRGLLR